MLKMILLGVVAVTWLMPLRTATALAQKAGPVGPVAPFKRPARVGQVVVASAGCPCCSTVISAINYIQPTFSS